MKGFGEKESSKSLNSYKKKKYSKQELITIGLEFHLKGKISDAAKYYQRFIDSGYSDSRVFNNYGVICKQSNQIDKAIKLYEKSIILYPLEPEAYANLGNLLSNDNSQINKAEMLLRKAIEIKPNYVEALCTLGNLLRKTGNLQEAKELTIKCISIKPNYSIANSNLGNIYQDLDNLNLALEYQRKAIAIDPRLSIAHNNIGAILHEKGQITEASISIQKAIDIDKNFPEAYSNLGSILIDLGEMEEAADRLNKAIELKPTLASALFSLSTLKNTFKDDWTKTLFSKEAISENISKDKIHIYFARSNVLHIRKNYIESEFNLKLANNLKLKLYPSNKKQLIKKSLQLMEVSKTLTPIAETKESESKEFIFIVGLPRSGTTLLESIISMESNVDDLGEINILEESITDWGGLQGKQSSIPLKEYYQKRIKSNRKITTNKWLYNYLYTGIIASQLPTAKIINCFRNPYDNILSIYRANFSRGNRYSSSIEDSAEILLNKEYLMKEYKKQYPSAIFDLNYDELVTNPEKVIVSLISWLGWEWNNNYLSPHLNKRTVHTASNVQVRSPISSKSVGGWKNYEKLVAPAKEIIKRSNY